MTGNLTRNELILICEVISSRFGLYFPEEMWKILVKNLSATARELGYKKMDDLIQPLLSSTTNKEQMEILAEHLTVAETYFWREPAVFSALTDYILPELIKKKNKEKKLRIWSAGCSTGEEPYSIAIALNRSIHGIKEWDISILATDINEKTLAKARLGIFNQWSFRTSPSWLKTNYFIQRSNRKFEISNEIKKMVTFSCSNLTEDNCYSAIRKSGAMDIIFCRNVLMYFTPGWAGEISNKLSHSLSDKGWLIVSCYELSSKLFKDFTHVNFPDATVYHKSPAESRKSFTLPDDTLKKPAKQFFKPSLDSVSEITKSQPPPINPPDYLPPQPVRIDPSYDKISAIRLLANQGHLSEALSSCDEFLKSNRLVPGLYLLRSSILQEMDNSIEAIRSLKQVIYIDPDYIMGHFTLGNIYFRRGNIKSARKFYNNTLDLLNARSTSDIPEESEGLSVEHIREIILTNLRIQK